MIGGFVGFVFFGLFGWVCGLFVGLVGVLSDGFYLFWFITFGGLFWVWIWVLVLVWMICGLCVLD